MDFLGAAAFSTAVQALDTKSGALVCLKVIKNCKDYFDQALDEVRMLRAVAAAEDESLIAAANASNAAAGVAGSGIVRLLDFFYYREHLFLVTELLRANLYDVVRACKRAAAAAEAAAAAAAEVAEATELERERRGGEAAGLVLAPPPIPPPPPPPYYFTLPRVQSIARQLLKSLAFLHGPRLGIVHCDVKPENVLLKSAASATVRLIDLGSACFATDPPSSYVQSRPYRAPEVVLGLPYDGRIDVWSAGCLVAELLSGGRPLFAADSAAGLLARVQGILLRGEALPERMRMEGRHVSRYYCFCSCCSGGGGGGSGSGGNGNGSCSCGNNGSSAKASPRVGGSEANLSPPLPALLFERSQRSGRVSILKPKKSSLAARVPGADAGALSFLEKVLSVDPTDRPSAKEALRHPWLAFDYEAGAGSAGAVTPPASPPLQSQQAAATTGVVAPEPLALID